MNGQLQVRDIRAVLCVSFLVFISIAVRSFWSVGLFMLDDLLPTYTTGGLRCWLFCRTPPIKDQG